MFLPLLLQQLVHTGLHRFVLCPQAFPSGIAGAVLAVDNLLRKADTLDEITDAVEYFGKAENYPGDYTYEEISNLNFGKYFKTPR